MAANLHTTHAQETFNWVWEGDDATGNWVKMTQPGGSSGGGAVTVADGADVAQGSTADSAWVSGAGTVISLLKKIASAGGSAVSIADGADVAQGTTTNVAVVSDSNGTVIGFLRGLVKMFATMWDSTKGRLNVSTVEVSTTTFSPASDGDTKIIDVTGKAVVTAIYTTVAQPTSYVTAKVSNDGGTTYKDIYPSPFNFTVPVTSQPSAYLGSSTVAHQWVVTGFTHLKLTNNNSGGNVLNLYTSSLPVNPKFNTSVLVGYSDGATVDVDNSFHAMKVILPDTSLMDLKKVNSTTTDTNSGLKSAGTLRVVLATDQPALTNKLLVTPDSVALPANQSVNVNQLAGTATAVNSGLKDAGTMRVVLATDQPALTNKLLVTPDSVALPANQSVNVNQIAGTAASVNSGVKDAGTLRVILATDQPALSNKLLVTPDAVAIPAGAAIIGKVGIDQTTPGTTNKVDIGTNGTVAITNLDVALSTRLKPADTLTGVTTVAAVTSITNPVTVTPPTLTKATQGSTGFSTQDLKDAGRVSIAITASVVSTATAETLISINKSSGLAAVGASSSIGITTGKRLRIQAISISARNSTGTTASNVTVNLRAAVGGATSATSPLQMHWMVALPASAVSTLFPTILIPDGFELDSNGATNTYGFTITHPQFAAGTVVATFDITLIGYEY